VRERLESEPIPLAPAAVRPARGSRFGPYIGAALAASAAFFAVFAVPQLFAPEGHSSTPVEQVAGLDMPAQFRLAEPGRRWHLDQPRLQNKLDRFLVNHQAYSPSSGFKGFLPYATVVGYDAGR
jgi:sigma-E factor negative regulatory protein RseA